MDKIMIDRCVVEQALEALNASMPHNNDMDEDWPSHIAARRALRAALEQPQVNSPEIPEGWKLVPVKPTEEMLDAAIDEADWRVKVPGADAEAVSVAEQMNNMAKAAMASTYRALLEAAPEAK